LNTGDLGLLIRSRVPILVIESDDEDEVLKAILRASGHSSDPAVQGDILAPAKPRTALPVFKWTVTDGLRRLDLGASAAQRTAAQPEEVLRHIRASNVAGTYVLLDFHPYLTDPVIVRLLKDIALEYSGCARTLILTSGKLSLPRELEPLSARSTLAVPGRDERRAIVEQIAREWRQAHPAEPVKADRRALDMLIENTSGLSVSETQHVARQAIFAHGTIRTADIPAVIQAKYELLNRHGILRYEPMVQGMPDLGGFERFKEWLSKRTVAFDGSAPELDVPKGVLLLGVQGCGKSLAARASAGIFNVPLLSFDCAALYDKYIGESERNLRESLESADLMAPCVLWIDEIEKGFASGESDGGAARRVLGGFLTWLAEKRTRVFVVATANEIDELPPELIRKGRFDELFFVDLPQLAQRRQILEIHAHKRGITLDPASLELLGEASEGFSGGEIEQAIVAALYTAHARHASPDAQMIRAELGATRPLAVVMAERVAALRAWAQERTVPAQ
jgi:ATPase family associated with various cellular activities (AAA)